MCPPPHHHTGSIKKPRTDAKQPEYKAAVVEEANGWTVPELRKALHARALDHSGRKAPCGRVLCPPAGPRPS